MQEEKQSSDQGLAEHGTAKDLPNWRKGLAVAILKLSRWIGGREIESVASGHDALSSQPVESGMAVKQTRSGPPQHWLDLVSEHAPQLLLPDDSPGLVAANLDKGQVQNASLAEPRAHSIGQANSIQKQAGLPSFTKPQAAQSRQRSSQMPSAESASEQLIKQREANAPLSEEAIDQQVVSRESVSMAPTEAAIRPIGSQQRAQQLSKSQGFLKLKAPPIANLEQKNGEGSNKARMRDLEVESCDLTQSQSDPFALHNPSQVTGRLSERVVIEKSNSSEQLPSGDSNSSGIHMQGQDSGSRETASQFKATRALTNLHNPPLFRQHTLDQAKQKKTLQSLEFNARSHLAFEDRQSLERTNSESVNTLVGSECSLGKSTNASERRAESQKNTASLKPSVSDSSAFQSPAFDLFASIDQERLFEGTMDRTRSEESEASRVEELIIDQRGTPWKR